MAQERGSSSKLMSFSSKISKETSRNSIDRMYRTIVVFICTSGDSVTTSIASVKVINSDATVRSTYMLPANTLMDRRLSHAAAGKSSTSLSHWIARIPQIYVSSLLVNPFSVASSDTSVLSWKLWSPISSFNVT